jgi:hypothetical protein
MQILMYTDYQYLKPWSRKEPAMRRLILALVAWSCFASVASSQETPRDWTVKPNYTFSDYQSIRFGSTDQLIFAPKAEFHLNGNRRGFTPTFSYDNSTIDGIHQSTLVSGGVIQEGNWSFGVFGSTTVRVGDVSNTSRLFNQQPSNAGDGFGYYFPTGPFPKGSAIQIMHEDKNRAFIARFVWKLP